jgi:hypothetical protein
MESQGPSIVAALFSVITSVRHKLLVLDVDKVGNRSVSVEMPRCRRPTALLPSPPSIGTYRPVYQGQRL